MNSRTSSISVSTIRPNRRPSLSSRLSFAISNAEQGEGGSAPTHVENQIDEEIEEIKRYEVFPPLANFTFWQGVLTDQNQDFTTIGNHWKLLSVGSVDPDSY